jgi:sarcosine oxidase
VIGLGAIGSACAYHLAKRGVRVLGIERFDLANDQASSGGYARQIKMAPYVGTPDEPLIRRAYQLWHELNADTGLPVIKQTGWIGVHPESFWSGRAIGSEYSLMTAQETHNRYPMMKVPDGFAGVFDPEGAVVRPRMGVAAHCRAALERGATLRARERVTSWSETTSGVEVRTNLGSYEADQLVLCAGTETVKLVPALAGHLVVRRIAVAWFWPDEPHRYSPKMIPNWEISGLYGFPIFDDFPGFEAGLFLDDQAPTGGAAERDPLGAAIGRVRERVDAVFGIGSAPLTGASICRYTSGGPFLGRHPQHSRLTIAVVCNGGGFKFAPATGEAVASIALGRQPDIPVDHMAVRFASPAT